MIIIHQFIFNIYKFSFLNISLIFGIDALSGTLILLSLILIYICLYIYWFLRYKLILYVSVLYFLSFLLIGLFMSLDLFLFYFFWKHINSDVFLIGIWGSRSRKIYAAYLFFFLYIIRICFYSYSDFFNLFK